MQLEDVDKFRKEAREQGLISNTSVESFSFDLNQGSMSSTDQDPEKISRLVLLARACASDEGYGEHNTLLNLVTEVERWGQRVYWSRAYHVNARSSDTRWISLREWLAWCGHPYIPTK